MSVNVEIAGVVDQRPPCKLKPLAGQPQHPLLAQLEKEGLLANVDNFLGVNKPRSLDAKATVDGFRYEQMVQPIWDIHCVSCHQGNVNDSDGKKRSALRLTGEVVPEEAFAGLVRFTQSY